jgi:fibronectin type 3 domain-containing protein
VIGWNASTGATQYQVERSTAASGPFQTVGTTQITQWTDSQVTAGTTYFYRVIANANGVLSAPSTIVSAAIQGSMPLAPSNLTGSGEKGYVRLAWRLMECPSAKSRRSEQTVPAILTNLSRRVADITIAFGPQTPPAKGSRARLQ